MENLVMRNTAEKLQTADEVWQKIESYEDQGCISCGPCSYPELTEDHVLPSA